MVEKTYIVTVTIPANAPAGTVIRATIKTDPQEAGVQTVQVPRNRKLLITDIFIISSPATDYQLVFRRNKDERVLITDPVSTLIVTNPSRPRYSVLEYDEMSMLDIDAVTLATAGSSAVTHTVFLKVVEVKKPEAVAPSLGWLSRLKI